MTGFSGAACSDVSGSINKIPTSTVLKKQLGHTNDTDRKDEHRLAAKIPPIRVLKKLTTVLLKIIVLLLNTILLFILSLTLIQFI
jgi:hypothetical protein